MPGLAPGGKVMKRMHGIYDGKTVKVLDPVPVDRPVEVEIVPVGPALNQPLLTKEQVQGKLARLLASLEGLTEEERLALTGARIDQVRFFRAHNG